MQLSLFIRTLRDVIRERAEGWARLQLQIASALRFEDIPSKDSEPSKGQELQALYKTTSN